METKICCEVYFYLAVFSSTSKNNIWPQKLQFYKRIWVKYKLIHSDFLLLRFVVFVIFTIAGIRDEVNPTKYD